jgi:hypothetical protein
MYRGQADRKTRVANIPATTPDEAIAELGAYGFRWPRNVSKLSYGLKTPLKDAFSSAPRGSLCQRLASWCVHGNDRLRSRIPTSEDDRRRRDPALGSIAKVEARRRASEPVDTF